MKSIAVIGSGISGLASSYLLQRKHRVSLFEANDRLGGHTATKEVEVASGRYAVDTGFIVFNERTYPLFLKLLEDIGLAKQNTQMSFSVSNRQTDFEYNGHTLNTLFAKRRNIVNPRFYRFLSELLRFNRLAVAEHSKGAVEVELTLADFLKQHGFSDFFCDNYILPMIAAIWSSSVGDARHFPLHFFLKFFVNHGLLQIANRPQWYVVPGGSHSYIPLLSKGIADIHLSSPVEAVRRNPQGVSLFANGQWQDFDEVIFACHSDQALAILGDQASDAERAILGAIAYRDNDVTLHTDTSVLPRRQRAWASWNFRLGQGEQAAPSVSYNMNILQGLKAPETFCVSLNQEGDINDDHVLGRYRYAHPVINTQTLAAQQRRGEICGHNHSHFCGAYWYNGFHEDGLRSAVDVAQRLGVPF